MPPILWMTAIGLGCGFAPDPFTEVTYSEQIAPILYEDCVGCHRSTGGAPFSLVTYEDASGRAEQLAKVTAARTMPPWLPESDGTFLGERRLSRAEISLIQAWAEAGAPRGDSTAAPEPPPPPPEWRLGEPDLVVQFPTYILRSEGLDVFRKLVVRAPIDRPRYVSAVELRPGDPQVVHHAVLGVDTTDSSRTLALQDDGPGFEGMDIRGNAENPDGHLVGWTPGKGVLPPQEKLAWRLEPESDLVLQLHMRPTGREERVESRIGFHFTRKPPQEHPVRVVLESAMIDIPAGDSDYRVKKSYELPVDVELLSIYPHAHYRGKDLRGYATFPDGSTKRLIRIPEWDFDWQDEFRYVHPLRLPAGTTVTLDFTFDNSSRNPDNPSDPPRRVFYGLNSTDEMAQLTLQLLPRDSSERKTLISHFRRGNRIQSAIYMAVQQVRNGNRSLEAGNPERAILHYRRALQHRFDYPEALIRLTRAFLMTDDFEAALLAGERARGATQGSDPVALSLLAEAYANARDDRAVPTAEKALRVARAVGRAALADSIEAQLSDYRGY